MRKALILLFVLQGFTAFSQLIDPFTIRYSTQQKGGIRFLANVAVSCDQSGLSCANAANDLPVTGSNPQDNNDFTQQYVDSVKKNTRNDFIHFYQVIDILIVDDVQFLSGKSGTQDVFFHIFNHLHQNGKQVILTSDKAPIDMQDIEQRLLSRFKWGLSAELQNPNFETRVSILKNKLYRDGVEIQDEVIEFVAKNINSNVRELEGAIISLIAQSSFNKAEITVDLAKEVINKFVKNNRREVSIDYIQKVVSDYFQMDIQTLQSKTRKRHIVQARQIAMYFAKKFTKASLASIGSQIGRRDHATVLHACKTVDNLSFTDKQFRKYVEDLNQKLSN